MGTSTPGSPAIGSRESSQGRDARKPRPRGGGSNKVSRPTSADQSPAPTSFAPAGQLFDPADVARRIAKPNTPTLDAPSRQPRGPESSGRGGFGFAGRGGKAPV